MSHLSRRHGDRESEEGRHDGGWVAPGEGRRIAVRSAGTSVTVKVSATETSGLCTVWEGRVPAGAVGAGPHSHHARDEVFYVLEGEVALRSGNESHTAQAGTFAFVPRDTIHGFHNASGTDATLLVVHHPAGFEQFRRSLRHATAAERTESRWRPGLT
jgi:mannose-6-phosphate isomerase-like protein (cupin superfamily)